MTKFVAVSGKTIAGVRSEYEESGQLTNMTFERKGAWVMENNEDYGEFHPIWVMTDAFGRSLTINLIRGWGIV